MPPSYRVLKGKKFGMVISKLFGIINKTSLNKDARRFTFDELLTPQQIGSFFSRECRKSKTEEKDLVSICRDDLIDNLHDQLTN
jgi:hypothetical protein